MLARSVVPGQVDLLFFFHAESRGLDSHRVHLQSNKLAILAIVVAYLWHFLSLRNILGLSCRNVGYAAYVILYCYNTALNIKMTAPTN